MSDWISPVDAYRRTLELGQDLIAAAFQSVPPGLAAHVAAANAFRVLALPTQPSVDV